MPNLEKSLDCSWPLSQHNEHASQFCHIASKVQKLCANEGSSCSKVITQLQSIQLAQQRLHVLHGGKELLEFINVALRREE